MAATAGRWLAVLLAGWGILGVPLALASQPVPVRVVLNAAPQADRIVLLQPDGDVWMAAADLQALGIEPGTEVRDVDGEPYVSLRALAPRVRFEFDDQEAVLQLTVDPETLPLQVLNLAQVGPKDIRYTDDNSAYLNYSVVYSRDDEIDEPAINAPAEVAVRLGSVLAYSSYLYEKQGEAGRTVRMLSNLTWDAPDARRRVVLGDATASTGRLGGGALLGGLRVATEPSLTPYELIYPELTLQGVLTTPSEVEVRVNDITVQTTRLAAGRFELRNLPYAVGAGEATLIIRDAFGRETRTEIPFYVSTTLLKAGVHDYGYNLGAVRQQFGEQNADYGPSAALAYHRYGVSDDLTLGVRGERNATLGNLGASVGVRLWRLGELELGAARSRDTGAEEGRAYEGRAGYVSYGYTSKHFGLRVSVQRQSREYANMSFGALEDKNRVVSTAGLGLPLGVVGSLGLSRRRVAGYVAEDSTVDSVFYSRRFGDSVSLSLRTSRERKEAEGVVETHHTLFAGLMVSFGGGHAVGATYSEEDDAASETLFVQKNAPSGPGWGYRLDAERDETAPPGDQWGGTAFARYNGPWGVYQLNRQQHPEGSSTAVTVAGSLAYVGGALMPSRPIDDAFALVRVGRLPGIRVYASNQEMGRTDSDGEILVPNLLAYYGNDLSIEERDAPFDYSIGRLHLLVAPPYRSGGVVPFDVRRIQAITGQLFFQRGEAREPATLAGLEVEVAGEKRTSVVGKGGLFYLENLAPGEYSARLFTEQRECTFTLVVPDREGNLVDLGDLACELP